MGIVLMKSSNQWGKIFGSDPVAHGTPAEALWLDAMDRMQMTALWGSVPHWSSNCVIPRSAALHIPVTIPAFVDQLIPAVCAAGTGTIDFQEGAGAGNTSTITIEGDEGNTDIEHAKMYKGGVFSILADTTGIDWIKVQCSSGVLVYALGFTYDRSVQTLVSAV